MSVELFLKLKEIDSLTKMTNSHLKSRTDQENRVSKLLERRQDTLMQTAKLKQELFSVHDEMAKIETDLKIASDQKQRLMDIGGDEKKISHYQQEISRLEEAGFELLTKTENIETEMSDSKSFLAGLDKTILEIQEETKAEIDKTNHEVENLRMRVTLLHDELPEDFKNLLDKTTAKNLAHGPFTRVEQGSCYFCRFKISRLEESEIDMQKSLKTCPQCGRIFLPFGS